MSEQIQPEDSVTRTTLLLHWIVAASVLFLFVSSWWMLALPLPSEVFTYRQLPFQLHKNVGLTLFLFVLVMLAIRIVSAVKQERVSRSWMQSLAVVDHFVIYFLLAAACLSGYMSSSYSGWETTVWWLIEIPAWTNENDELNMFFSDIHMWSCWALLAIITTHIAAAIYHAFNNDGMINKMFRLPWGSPD